MKTTLKSVFFALLLSFASFPCLAAEERITDAALLIAFRDAINGQGFNCEALWGVTRMDTEDTHGRLFLAICVGGKYRHEYRISVNPAGIAFVRPRY